MKYTIRKLVFILVLFALLASPFAVIEYRSLNTDDPFILMARDIEKGFQSGEVDVLAIFPFPEKPNILSFLVYIPNFSDWSDNIRENLKRYILDLTRGTDYDSIEIAIGWDFPPAQFRIQGLYICDKTFKSANCAWSGDLGLRVDTNFIEWPGIGNP